MLSGSRARRMIHADDRCWRTTGANFKPPVRTLMSVGGSKGSRRWPLADHSRSGSAEHRMTGQQLVSNEL